VRSVLVLCAGQGLQQHARVAPVGQIAAAVDWASSNCSCVVSGFCAASCRCMHELLLVRRVLWLAACIARVVHSSALFREGSRAAVLSWQQRNGPLVHDLHSQWGEWWARDLLECSGTCALAVTARHRTSMSLLLYVLRMHPRVHNLAQVQLFVVL
jgi:hypothetical protein